MKEFFHSQSTEDTLKLGQRIGSFLKANDVIALTGQLGAGKTTLIQGIAAGLGVKDYVTSPTFIIINEYDGRLPLYHIDLYRLNEGLEVADLGIEEYFRRGGVTVIEWAERLGGLLPPGAEKIELEIVSESGRKFSLSPALSARLTGLSF
jgi:tRNA threonylcarbamoyladenosine biosynthesis protein TsaE